MGVFRTLPTKDRFGIPKDKSSLGYRPTRRNLWAFARWTDALTTVQHSVRNRPERERKEDSPVAARQADGDSRLPNPDLATWKKEGDDVLSRSEYENGSLVSVPREDGDSRLYDLDQATLHEKDPDPDLATLNEYDHDPDPAIMNDEGTHVETYSTAKPVGQLEGA